MTRQWRWVLLAVAACVMAVSQGVGADEQGANDSTQAPSRPRAKNVILMISDGTGWYSWDAATYYLYGELGKAPQDAFAVHYPVSTYPAVLGQGEKAKPHPGYDPEMTWNQEMINWAPSDQPPATQPKEAGARHFVGYEHIKQWATDSAAAATAMATGVKTYDGAIGVDVNGQALQTIAEIAKEHGKSAGVVTSVPLCHATPAGFVAHVANRNLYMQISQQMLYKSPLDVIMGAGNPMEGLAGGGDPDYTKVGGKVGWMQVEKGKTPWTLVQTREDFQALAQSADPPARVLGVPLAKDKIDATGAVADQDRKTPTLAVMTQGALSVLGQNPEGFFLMVEGGAPDWGAHNNDLRMLVDELVDFYAAVQTVVSWVEAHGGWDENLVIITTDHANGMLMGPESDQEFWQPIVNNGKGELPGAKFHTGGHANTLVKLWANGAGAELFAKHATHEDAKLAERFAGWGPAYVDNTDIFKVMLEAMWPAPGSETADAPRVPK